MDYEWEQTKAESNLRKHGVSFEAVYDFDWDSALILEDNRHDYGEDRYRATGYVGTHLYALVFTYRGDIIRLISLRLATSGEKKYYESNS